MALNLDTIGNKIGPITKDYSWKDVVLYALGVGAGFEDLEYCYEDRLKVIPIFSIGSSFDFPAAVGMDSGANLAGILHGEQDIIFHDTIPVEGTLTSEGTITHMYDKSDGKVPCQVDGGLKCFGHPIGASGLRMIYEMYLQFHGRAGERQLEEPRVDLTHNLGGFPFMNISCISILGKYGV